MKSLIVIGVLFSASTLACDYDFECGFGRVCVKIKNSATLSGTCLAPANQIRKMDLPEGIMRQEEREIERKELVTEPVSARSGRDVPR